MQMWLRGLRLALLPGPHQHGQDPSTEALPSSAFSPVHPLAQLGTSLSHDSSFWVLTAFIIRKYPLPHYTF